MKSLITLTAIAALVAGISVASAQSSMSNSMKDKTAAEGTGAYCLTGKSGPKNCSFASIAACQKASNGNAAACAPNPKSATTGSKN